MELMYTVPGKKSRGIMIAGIVLLVLTALCLVMGVLTMGNPLFLFLFLLFGLLWFFLIYRMEVVFDYSYWPEDGDFEVARITNKSSRKLILHTNLDEMYLLAPENDQAVLAYNHDSAFKYIDFSSGRKDVKCYLLFCQGRKSKVCLRFEPAERMVLALTVGCEKLKTSGKVVL